MYRNSVVTEVPGRKARKDHVAVMFKGDSRVVFNSWR